MTLPGETVGTGAPNPCPGCGYLSILQVLESGAGFYLGHLCRCGPPPGAEAPYSRESARYWGTRSEASDAIVTGEWERRSTEYTGGPPSPLPTPAPIDAAQKAYALVMKTPPVDVVEGFAKAFRGEGSLLAVVGPRFYIGVTAGLPMLVSECSCGDDTCEGWRCEPEVVVTGHKALLEIEDLRALVEEEGGELLGRATVPKDNEVFCDRCRRWKLWTEFIKLAEFDIVPICLRCVEEIIEKESTKL